MQNLPKLYKIRKKPILDPGAMMYQQAGTGIWHCNTPKNTQKQQHKKIERNKRNRNWQSSRRNDMEAVNQLFGANKAEIKQKTLEALRLFRQADHALNEVCKYFDDLKPEGPLIPRKSVREKLEMSSGKLTRKQDGCLSQLFSASQN
jgi:hypothetical protein